MAIADRATSSANSGTQQTSLSWSHAVTAGSDRVLYVAISIDGAGGTYSYDASATYNGVSMTRIHQGNTNQYLAIFRLIAPDTGSNTVQVSWTGSQYPSGVAISYTGVDQTTPEDSVTANTSSSGTSFSNAISSETDDLVLACYSVNNNTTPLTATGSGTSRAETGSTPFTSVGVSDAAGAASVTTGWSWSGSNRYSGGSFNVNAAGAGGTPHTAEPGAAALTWAGQAVTVQAAASLAPGAAALSWAGQAATVQAAAALAPGAAALTWFGQAVTVQAAANLAPGAAALAWQGLQASFGAGVEITVGAAALVWAGQAPVVSAAAVLSPGAAALAWFGQTVTVQAASISAPPARRTYRLNAAARRAVLAQQLRAYVLAAASRTTRLPEDDET